MMDADLLYGSWLALEQAGRLLRSARALVNLGDCSSAFALAMFGREEVGRSQILRRLAERVRAGEQLAPDDVQKACDDHVVKQKASQLSTTLIAHRNTTLGNAMHTLLTRPINSPGYLEAQEGVQSATRAKERRIAKTRHDMRMHALYVDLDSGGTWSCPQALDSELLTSEIVEAINEYAHEYDRLRDEVIEDDFPAMAAARRALRPGFVLPAPPWLHESEQRLAGANYDKPDDGPVT